MRFYGTFFGKKSQAQTVAQANEAVDMAASFLLPGLPADMPRMSDMQIAQMLEDARGQVVMDLSRQIQDIRVAQRSHQANARAMQSVDALLEQLSAL